MNRPSELILPAVQPEARSRILRLVAVYLVLAALLVFALRKAPLSRIWESLKHLDLWQVGILFIINALVIAFMTARWWFVARAEKPRLPFLPLIGYRLSVFGLSYFTPGPQVGGEPLQVIYLRRYHGFGFPRAVSIVIIDKLLEFFGNFVFIAVGLLAVIRAGILPAGDFPALAWLAIAALLVWPALHLFLLSRRVHPLTRLLRSLLPRWAHRKWFRLAIVSEHLAGTFTRRHPAALSAALIASLLAWTGMAAEYLLMLNFLEVHLQLWQSLASLTASMLAFLMPLPGGLGALEASQVLAIGSFGYPAAAAISLTLLMRARDLLNGGLGLILAARNLGR